MAAAALAAMAASFVRAPALARWLSAIRKPSVSPDSGQTPSSRS
jgi:hypothetical protein